MDSSPPASGDGGGANPTTFLSAEPEGSRADRPQASGLVDSRKPYRLRIAIGSWRPAGHAQGLGPAQLVLDP